MSDNGPKSELHSKHVKPNEEVDDTTFPTVFIEHAMVGIDLPLGEATLTLLSRHIAPKIVERGWGLDVVKWKVEAEIKLPIPVMDTLVHYYIQAISGGLNIIPIVREYVKDHPIDPEKAKGGNDLWTFESSPQPPATTGIKLRSAKMTFGPGIDSEGNLNH